jgi:hypothetical protein
VQPHDECCTLLLSELTEEPQKYCQPCKEGKPPSLLNSTETIACEKTTTPCICNKKRKPGGRRYSFSPSAMLQKLASIHWDKEDIDYLNRTKKDDEAEYHLEGQPMKELDDRENDCEHDDDDDDDDDDQNSFNKSCGICLEKFRVGEAVSWSCDPGCEHVFHHECLRNWLLRRVRCPFCRTIVLAVDKPPRKEDGTMKKRSMFGGGKFTYEELHHMAGERARYLTQTYFCVEEGLVLLRSLDDDPLPSSNNNSSSKEAMTTKGEPSVDKSSTTEAASSTTTTALRRLQFWKCRRREDHVSITHTTTRIIHSVDDSVGDGDLCNIDESGICRTARLGGSGNDDTFDDDMDEEEGDNSSMDGSGSDDAGISSTTSSSSSSGSSSDDEGDHSDHSHHNNSAGCSSTEESSSQISSSSAVHEDEQVVIMDNV